MMRETKTGPNISVSHVIKSFTLSLPPVFDTFVIFFFFLNCCLILATQQERNIYLTRPTVILNPYIAIKIMKAGNLWHYAAFLLQLCYVCRGPLKPSIFRFNVGLYTHTCTFFPQMCVWWCFVAAKRLFRFSLHAGAIDSSHNSELADCSTSYETTSNKVTSCSI